MYQTDDFRMYAFKILPCSKRYTHDWTTCPFTHPGEKAQRRDPRQFSYTGIACPELKKNAKGICPRGDACPFSHTVFEYWCHPSRYRTQMCNDVSNLASGMQCKRKVCFFAHKVEELRVSNVKVGGSTDGKDFLEDYAFDGMDPFSSSASNATAEAILQQMASFGMNGSPSSSLDQSGLHSFGIGSSCNSSRRSSIQLQLAGQRQSMDQGPRAASLLHQRTSLDLASAEMNLQKLQLVAANAQLQLQQAAAIHQLTTALTQIQLGNQLGSLLMPDSQLLLAQQMLLQQESWNHAAQGAERLPALSSLELGANGEPNFNAPNAYNSFPTISPEVQSSSGSPKSLFSPWTQPPGSNPQDQARGLYF